MKCKNKVVSLLLALCMVLSLLPTAAFAAEEPAQEPAEAVVQQEETAEPETSVEPEDETPAAVQSAAGNGIAVQATNAAGHTVRDAALDLTDADTDQSSADEGWTWDPNTNTLTLNNCTIEATDADSNGIKLPDDADVQLVLQGENRVSAANGSAIKGNGDRKLTISGNGSLEAKSDQKYASVVNCGNLELNSGTVNLVATSAAYTGVEVRRSLTVNGGTLSAVGFNRVGILCSGGTIAINGGRVTVSGVSGAIGGTRTDNITVKDGTTIRGGDDADNARDLTTVENVKYLEITAPAPAAPAFTDGMGDKSLTFDSFAKGDTNDKGYTFNGWFDGTTELTSADAAMDGKLYTAKWTKDGKTVRTAPLDLIDENDCGSAEEGWSWNAATKTLTLSGAIFDMFDDTTAVALPAGAVITTEAGTVNTIINSSKDDGMGLGVMAKGTLTINGSGELSVAGYDAGLYVTGDLNIDAPISVSCQMMAAILVAPATYTITLADSLRITEPADGAILPGEGMVTIGSGDSAAKKVVIKAPVTAPAFTDGFGNTADNADTYQKGVTKNSSGYTFAGWFDENGNELTDVSKAAAGVTYTARWARDGKLVRTEVLDLSRQTVDQKDIAEGWSWDAKSKTLTLSGFTIDVNEHTIEPDFSGEGAILLPDGATVTTAKGTKNLVVNSSVIETVLGLYIGGGILCEGALTIGGAGQLSITGGCYGILTMDGLTVNAPLSIRCTATEGNIYPLMVHDGDHAAPATGKETITIASSLYIKTPAGGKIVSKDMSDEVKLVYVVDGSGKAAKNVVIDFADAVFTDGLGNTIDNAAGYVKGKTTNAKGYTFAGWFDENGNELSDASKAAAGVTYTARWSRDGKLVRTEVLDLSRQTVDQKDIAEGWSWDAKSKTLTLSGFTIDVNKQGSEPDMDGFAAIELPDGATVTTTKGSKNIVVNGSVINASVGPVTGIGIAGNGALTITGSGVLSITAGSFGISAEGDIRIKAPISVSVTDTRENATAVLTGDGRKLTIASSLRIKTPARGKVVSSELGQFIAEKDGTTRAKDVVIVEAASSGSGSGSTGGAATSAKTGDAGIALYAGMAVMALLGSGVVCGRKRREF